MFLLAVTKIATNDEMVKQMQEQVISMQDKQMSFLNDTIGNTNDSITLFLSALGAISAVVIGVITYVHGQAKNRMDEAEKKMNEAKEKMNEATQKIARAESLTNTASETIENLNTLRNEVHTYRTETEQRVQELSVMIDNKMTKLKEIENSTNDLVITHKLREVLMKLGKELTYTGLELQFLQQIDWAKKGMPEPDIQHFKERFEHLKKEHERGREYMDELSLGNIKTFYKHCLTLYQDSLALLREIQDTRFKAYEDENSSKD